MAGALKPIATGPVKIISILTGGQVCEKPFGYNILKKIC
jgi:hypothetical protein